LPLRITTVLIGICSGCFLNMYKDALIYYK